MLLRLSTAIVAASLVAGVLVGVGAGRPGATAERVAALSAGNPERGRAVYFGPGGCSGCHSVSADPDEPSTGPQLTLALLTADAAQAGKPLGAFVAESILVPGAFVPAGYVSGMMQPPSGLSRQQIDDLVSYLIGKPYTSPASGPLTFPAKPIAACRRSKQCTRTVSRWKATQRLPARALDGARITAVVGCLSCHVYAGSGRRSGSAPALTRAGAKKTTLAAHVRRLRCPRCVRSGSVMPSYRALGDVNLRRIAVFLLSSRGARR